MIQASLGVPTPPFTHANEKLWRAPRETAAPTAARPSHATISGFRIAVARDELGTQARQRRAAFPEDSAIRSSCAAATAQSGGTCRSIDPSSRRPRTRTRDKRSFRRPSPGDREKLREPRETRDQAAAFVGDARGDKAWMQAIGGHPVSSRRRASSRVNKMLQSLERL